MLTVESEGPRYTFSKFVWTFGNLIWRNLCFPFLSVLHRRKRNEWWLQNSTSEIAGINLEMKGIARFPMQHGLAPATLPNDQHPRWQRYWVVRWICARFGPLTEDTWHLWFHTGREQEDSEVDVQVAEPLAWDEKRVRQWKSCIYLSPLRIAFSWFGNKTKALACRVENEKHKIVIPIMKIVISMNVIANDTSLHVHWGGNHQ